MDDLIKVRLELEGIKHTIIHAFSSSQEEISDMVSKSLDEILKPEIMQRTVNDAVTKCVYSAIDELSTNYEVKKAIQSFIAKQLTQYLDKKL